MSAEDSWRQNRNSSKAWLVVVLLLILAYGIIHIIRLLKTKPGINGFLQAFLSAMEIDMMPVLVIYAICVVLGAFYIFACFLGYLLVVPLIILTIGYGKQPRNDMLILVGKGLNAGFVLACFMIIWIDDLKFY